MRIALAFAALLFAVPAIAADYGRDPLPRDEASLQRLNNEQLRVVRRATHICAQQSGSLRIRAERNPCVISSTDKAIGDSDDRALQAFHAALPDSERYDENRPDTTWRALLVGYHD